MMLIIFFIITNAFLKNEFYTLFSNTIAKVYQLRRGTGCTRNKLFHTTKVLAISIFTPFLHN